MRRSQVQELYYITHVGNVASILERGILSHNRAAPYKHSRVDLEVVQEIRERIPVGDRWLHDHANLYVCARNAMMYHVKSNNPIDEICLLRVSPEVIDLADVVVTDGNAARRYETRMADAPSGIAALDYDRVHAHSWNHANVTEKYEHKRVKQAEVLVPDVVEPRYVVGVFVPTDACAATIRAATGGRLAVERWGYPFFIGLRGGRACA